MHKLIKLWFGLILITALTGVSGSSCAAVAGHVQFVNGMLQRTDMSGHVSTLQKGQAVDEGDTLNTDADATAQIKMIDGGMIAMRPDTQFKIDSFKFNGQQDGSEQGFFALVKGGFRAVTGLIGQVHKSSYHISTVTATIGIRGTDHETLVVIPGSPLASIAAPGTYNKVNEGETSMTNQAGMIAILPNQMGYAASATQLPQLVPVNPALFNAVPNPSGTAKTQGVRAMAVVDHILQNTIVNPGFEVTSTFNFTRQPITVTVTPVAPIGIVAPPLPVQISF